VRIAVEYLVEHYWPGVTQDAFRHAAELVRASADTLEGIRFLHSTLVPEDESAFCVFAASSSALVAEAYRLAGVPYERILDALDVSGGD
jgi:hypothetical protein